MSSINDLKSLDERIAFLEMRRNAEKDAIAAEVNAFKEKLKPANLLRSTFRSVQQSPELKSDLLHGAIGLATGFVTNKVVLGKLHGPWKALLSVLIQAGFVNVAVKQTDTIKSAVLSGLVRFLKAIRLKDPDQAEGQAISEN